MKKQHIEIGLYVCALLLAVGVFLPLTELIIVGEVTYHDIADIEAYLIVALSIAGVVLSLTKPRLTLLAPVGSWIVLLFPAIENALESDDGGLLSQVRDRAQGVMHDFAAEFLPDILSNIADMHWGGFVFLAGLLGFTIFGVMRTIKG